MDNLAYKEEDREELIDGEVILMSLSTSTNHNRIASNITMLFKMYLKGKKCEVFQDNIDLHLSEKDIVIPDMMVVCNKGVVRSDGIYGAPNLIVEILSPSTAKKTKVKRKYYMKNIVYQNIG